jgi:hypothetical protein
MAPNLPEPLESLLRPIFVALPLDRAMTALVVEGEADHTLASTVESIVANPVMQSRPALVAGLWLYIDDLHRSHAVSQEIDNATGSFWHGIMHRREGDFSNSHYWFRKVGKHPAMTRIDMAGGGAGAGTEVAHYDAHAFIDRVETAHRQHKPAADLIALQRHEWLALFEWCAQR